MNAKGNNIDDDDDDDTLIQILKGLVDEVPLMALLQTTTGYM